MTDYSAFPASTQQPTVGQPALLAPPSAYTLWLSTDGEPTEPAEPKRFVRKDGVWVPIEFQVEVGGGDPEIEVRSDTTATHSYMGTAPLDTAEASSGWTVTRITLSSPPVVETGTGTWSGRAGLSYS